MASDVAKLRARVETLEDLCSEVYQIAGTLGAPARVLDQLLAASEGRDLPYQSLLPFGLTEVSPGRAAAVIGAHGGLVTSRRKSLASRRNGLLGGRPPLEASRAARRR